MDENRGTDAAQTRDIKINSRESTELQAAFKGTSYERLFPLMGHPTVFELLSKMRNAIIYQGNEQEEMPIYACDPLLGLPLDPKGNYVTTNMKQAQIYLYKAMEAREAILRILEPTLDRVSPKQAHNFQIFFLRPQAEVMEAIAEQLNVAPGKKLSVAPEAIIALPTSIPDLYLTQWFIRDEYDGRIWRYEYLLHLPKAALKELKIEGMPEGLDPAIKNVHIPYDENYAPTSSLPLAA